MAAGIAVPTLFDVWEKGVAEWVAAPVYKICNWAECRASLDSEDLYYGSWPVIQLLQPSPSTPGGVDHCRRLWEQHRPCTTYFKQEMERLMSPGSDGDMWCQYRGSRARDWQDPDIECWTAG